MKKELWQITLPWATFGIEIDVETERVIDAAPIAKWTKGWKKHTILNYYKDREGKVELIGETR